MVLAGFQKISDARSQRFLGQVTETENALPRRSEEPAVPADALALIGSEYWGTGDASSLPTGYLSKKGPAFRGVTGALLDLEYQRIELIKFNLFDNNGTWRTYVTGLRVWGARVLKTWPEMRLPAANSKYQAVGGAGEQTCTGDSIRPRTPRRGSPTHIPRR